MDQRNIIICIIFFIDVYYFDKGFDGMKSRVSRKLKESLHYKDDPVMVRLIIFGKKINSANSSGESLWNMQGRAINMVDSAKIELLLQHKIGVGLCMNNWLMDLPN